MTPGFMERVDETPAVAQLAALLFRSSFLVLSNRMFAIIPEVILISKHTLLSLAQPHLIAHVTAATLSPRISVESTDSGLSPVN